MFGHQLVIRIGMSVAMSNSSQGFLADYQVPTTTVLMTSRGV